MNKYVILLLVATASTSGAQQDERSRVTKEQQEITLPPTPSSLPIVQPPVRQEMPQPPRDVARQLPLPMDPYWNSRRPSRDDCFNMPPQFRTICMDMGTSRNRSVNFRPTNKPLRQQIQRATPQQRRQIQRAREEFKRKVRIILKK
jgi:hypothetical protein